MSYSQLLVSVLIVQQYANITVVRRTSCINQAHLFCLTFMCHS